MKHDSGIRSVKLPRYKVISDRENLLVNLSIGKRVLHVGCVGTRGTEYEAPLHAKLHSVADYCLGVDVNEKGLDALGDYNSSFNLESIGACDPLIQRLEQRFDYIILGEVLEHMESAGMAIRHFSSLMKGNRSQLVITVPNAFGIRNIIGLLVNHTETTRLDHYCYYSPITLNSLLRDCGLKVDREMVYSNVTGGWSFRKLIKYIIINNLILKVRPCFAEGLIVIATNAESI